MEIVIRHAETNAVDVASSIELATRWTFEEFWRTERASVARALALTLGDVQLAAEATDEAMARAFQHWSRVSTLDSPTGWAYRVGLNWSRSVLRRLRRQPPQWLAQPNTQHDAAPLDPSVAAALRKLPAGQRAVVVCRLLLNQSEQQTATLLRIRPGTVKSRLSRAIAHLAHLTCPPRPTGEPVMNEFDEQTSRISKVLRDTASELEVPTVGVSAVRRHGSIRQHRRRAGIATVSAVALLGAGALTVQRLSHNPSPTTGPAAAPSTDGASTSTPIETTIPGPASTTPGRVSDPESSGEPVQRVDSAFVWNAVEPGSAEAVSRLVWGIGPTQEAPYFAWSTAPGPTTDGSYQPVLYRSDDGIRWAPAEDGTFTEPQVSKRGLASQNGMLFAFGTAAAIAAIPQGGAGDAVVDVSSDGGVSWQSQVLPLDLRSLAAMDGVGGVGMTGGMAAANGVVVAVAQPNVWWDAAGNGRELAMTANGAYEITYPQCSGPDCNPPVTTISTGPTVDASPSDTAVSDTSPADTSPSGTVSQIVEDTVPTVSGLISFEKLGIDPASVAAARAPRAFVSTNGADFTEAEFPAFPDPVTANGGDIRVFTAGEAFYVTVSASTFDPAGLGTEGGGHDRTTLVYRSIDGVNWESVARASNRELLGVMSDGTLVGDAYTADGSSNIATSTDGETWQVHDLRPLIDPSDGKIVYVDLWSVSVDEQGITALGAMANDPLAEAGGRSMEHGGVRLEVASSRSGDPTAFDIATGDAIPYNMLRWNDGGALLVLDADGGIRATFTGDEQNQLRGDGSGQTSTKVLLHSDDGVNWSRENLADLTGSPDAGPGFIQTQDGKLLVTVIDPARRTNTMATTTVLVGTRK